MTAPAPFTGFSRAGIQFLADLRQNNDRAWFGARKGEYEAVIPGHLLTTFYYLLAKHADTATASTAVDGLLADFEVVGADKRVFAHARALPMKDFEDGVVRLEKPF